jgi:hypothetical protein
VRWLPLLLVPALAFGEAEPQRPPTTDGCQPGRAAANVETLAVRLEAGARTWPRLLRSGPAGCEAVLAWLEGGAPGARNDVVADVVARLAPAAGPGVLPRLAALYGRLGEAGDAALLQGLTVRQAALSPKLADLIGREQRPAVRPATVGLLLGVDATHEEVQRLGDGLRLLRRSRVAPTPDAHRQALDAQLARPSRALRDALVDALAVLAEAGAEDPGAFELLVPLVTLAPRADRPLAEQAAWALGRSQAPAAAEGLRRLVEHDDPASDALSWFLDGVERRLLTGGGDGATLALLDKAAEADGPPGARARRLRTRWMDRVKEKR